VILKLVRLIALAGLALGLAIVFGVLTFGSVIQMIH
jgi:hypothetical protein